jgi:hypothetical protein
MRDQANLLEWRARPEQRAKACVKSKKYREANPLTDEERVVRKIYLKDRRERIKRDPVAYAEQLANDRKRNREKSVETKRIKVARHRAKRYGLTPEAVEVLLQVQGGRCPICNTELGKSRSHIDHDHATGRVRGILCLKCNAGIGMLADSPDRLAAAIAYLKRGI